MSGAEILDTPTTVYAYTEGRDGWNNRLLTVWCWSHEFKRWGSAKPTKFADWHWGQQKLPKDAVSFDLHRGLTPYDAARKMGVIQ